MYGCYARGGLFIRLRHGVQRFLDGLRHARARHDGGLALVFNGFEGGKCRNDGFPGTDVARNEALHRMREGEPRVDFGRHALLSAGKREGEGVRKGAGERVVFSVERRCREVPFFRSALSR